MIVIVKDLISDSEQAFSGSEGQVEDQLRHAFPGIALTVELGDLDSLIYRLGGCYGKLIEVPEGHVAKPELHLPIRFDPMPHTCGVLCNGLSKAEEETPFQDRVDGWLLEKAIADIPPGADTDKQANFKHDQIPSQIYDYSHVVPEHLKHQYRIEVHERPKGANNVPGGTWLEAFLVKHPFDFIHDDVGKASGMVHPKYKNGDKDFRVALADINAEHRGKKLGIALYEALMAHAKHYHGTTHIVGGQHSTMAHNAHEAISKKHGMEYNAELTGSDDYDDFGPGEFDDAYGPYMYAIKSEAEIQLIKADRTAFKEAGFRHKQTGEVAGTGVFHNIYELPEHWKVDEDHIDHIEAGFIDHAGKFYTRSEAAAKISAPKENLQSEDIQGMGRKPGEESLGGGAGLVKMAIADIPPGIEKKGQKKYGLTRYSKFFDYSHVLSPLQKRHYFLTVVPGFGGGGPQEREKYFVRCYSRRLRDYRGWPTMVGDASVRIKDHTGAGEGAPYPEQGYRAVTIDDVRVHQRYRNKGLGTAIYEAAFAHAKHKHNATHVVGGRHSTLAGAVHAKLAAKHGLDYHPVHNEYDWGDMKPTGGDYDYAHDSYQYTLKSELKKMALADIKPGDKIAKPDFDPYERTEDIPPEEFEGDWHDYSHVLSPAHQHDYEIHVNNIPDPQTGRMLVNGHLFHKYGPIRKHAGILTAERFGPTLQIVESHVNDFHRGRGLGTKLYEAVLAHGYHHLNTTHAGGGYHSSMANRSHEKLAQQHGFEGYKPLPRTTSRPVGPYDGKYGGYKYTLKSDDSSWLALADNLNGTTNEDSEMVEDMAGFSPRVHSAFEAARFLVNGREALSLDQIRRALWLEDGDFERAALRAYDIEPDEVHLSSLRAVMKLGFLKKFEKDAPERVDCPVSFSATACSEVQRGISSGMVQHVNLNGKYSKGAMVVRDPRTQHVYLLKPDSEGISPAAGVAEQDISQPRREAAYWQVANMLGLGAVIPRADLVHLDNEEWAAIRLLPYNFKNLEKRWRAAKNEVMGVMERYRAQGQLHKWAILDYILGNPDRHGQNLMIGHGEKTAPADRELVLIDHGSAFAGNAFAPSADANSFIPFYLRAWAPSGNFNKLSPNDKLKAMPTVSHDVNEMLKRFIREIPETRIEKLVKQYGIDPAPVLMRISKLKSLPDAPDIAICKLWAGAA